MRWLNPQSWRRATDGDWYDEVEREGISEPEGGGAAVAGMVPRGGAPVGGFAEVEVVEGCQSMPINANRGIQHAANSAYPGFLADLMWT